MASRCREAHPSLRASEELILWVSCPLPSCLALVSGSTCSAAASTPRCCRNGAQGLLLGGPHLSPWGHKSFGVHVQVPLDPTLSSYSGVPVNLVLEPLKAPTSNLRHSPCPVASTEKGPQARPPSEASLSAIAAWPWLSWEIPNRNRDKPTLHCTPRHSIFSQRADNILTLALSFSTNLPLQSIPLPTWRHETPPLAPYGGIPLCKPQVSLPWLRGHVWSELLIFTLYIWWQVWEFQTLSPQIWACFLTQCFKSLS